MTSSTNTYGLVRKKNADQVTTGAPDIARRAWEARQRAVQVILPFDETGTSDLLAIEACGWVLDRTEAVFIPMKQESTDVYWWRWSEHIRGQVVGVYLFRWPHPQIGPPMLPPAQVPFQGPPPRMVVIPPYHP